MPWSVHFHPDAAKELKKLGGTNAERILDVLQKRIATAKDPRLLGGPLKGDHSGDWRWRVGDYRIIASINDERLLILIVRVAHRREAYR